MGSTGRFGTDNIAAAAPRELPARPAAVPAASVAGAASAGNSPFLNWAERMQRTRGRHAAITRNLYTWSGYKNWTETVKDGWQDASADDASADKEPDKP